MTYTPADDRYAARTDHWFRRCGNSGLVLPAISLGCWHNFGDAGTDPRSLPEADFHHNAQQMLFTAFDRGITHFDLANNYGPAPGTAETRVGQILKHDFAGYRDELMISSKAGYRMWPGPYGEWGSRKSLLASLDQSLQRLQLDYVDIFYHHRPDPTPGGTPLEESLGALDAAVRAGKALYVGISNYSPQRTREALQVCKDHGFAKPIIHQPSYSMLNRNIEHGLLDATGDLGLGVIPFSPLAQGLLTNKYLSVIPDDSRAKADSQFLSEDRITPELQAKLRSLNTIAEARGQSLSQLALRWALRDTRVTSALIGASRPDQIAQCCDALHGPDLSPEELNQIEDILS
ncbi:MAG: aldo/keto reductase [Planctomycetota bacterium]